MTTLGSHLIQVAREAVAIAKGEADPVTYRVHIPAELNVAGIRKELGLTQAAFAARYGFRIGTLRDLEQGWARPDASTRAYLTVISREPEAMPRTLAPAA